MDDADRLRFAPRVKNKAADERSPYKGNKNPSQREYAAEGYETLTMADPSATYFNTVEDRDTLAPSTEYDSTMVRRDF